MAITDKKGINVTSGFKLVSKQPLDARLIAVDETDLQSLIDNGAVYDGLMVWVQSLGKYMSYNGTEFKELETEAGGTPAYVENETLFLGNISSGDAEDEVTVIDLSTEATLVDGEYQYDLLENGRYIIDYASITEKVKINFGNFKYKKGAEEVTLGKFLSGNLVNSQTYFYDYIQESDNSWVQVQARGTETDDFPFMVEVSKRTVIFHSHMDSTA